VRAYHKGQEVEGPGLVRWGDGEDSHSRRQEGGLERQGHGPRLHASTSTAG